MISLKEACRYKNFLNNTIASIVNLLNNKSNITEVVETHYKSKGNPNATDEIISEPSERIFTCKANDLVYLVKALTDESLALSIAINKAKSEKINWEENGEKIDLDTAIEYNKVVRNQIEEFKPLTTIKNKLIKTDGRDYLINGEGNQVSYFYPIEKEVKIDFDKKVVANLVKKLLEKTDKISIAIEEFMLREIVDISPKYNIHDTVEEIIATYEENLGK